MSKLPVFFENSELPVILSKVSPIDIGAITLGPFVFSRGPVSAVTKNHESIHWRQYLELGILGFPILYGLFYLIGRVKGKNGNDAYHDIPFELEAYAHERDFEYLRKRRSFSWTKFIRGPAQ